MSPSRTANMLIDMAQQLSHQLRAAQQRISELEAEVVAVPCAASPLLQKPIFNFCIDLVQPLFSALSLVLIRAAPWPES
jgi:hypothetical protein